MAFLCQDHFDLKPLKVSYHAAKSGDHRHCGSRDIMFLVDEGEDSRCFSFNPVLLFISKEHGFKSQIIPYQLLRFWSHAFKAPTGEKIPVRQKWQHEGKEKI